MAEVTQPTGFNMFHKPGTLLIIAVLSLLLSSCSPREVVYIGYLGGLSGRVTDLGIGGLNGVRLATEIRNQQGGIKGRMVEIVEADDQQNPEIARQAVERLIDHKVHAIIGPMTSAMAMATVPLINQAKLLMISPTVTTGDLNGLDDYFFRVIPTTRNFVKTNTNYYRHVLGLQRIRLVYDIRNKSYSESWLQEFTEAFQTSGGHPLPAIAFSSSDETRFPELARQTLQDKPDGIIILSNSVDAAMLCQSLRKLDPSISIGTSEWAATERLPELGGKSVEGITVAQFFDRQSTLTSYLKFKTAFLNRFKREPGFAELFAFDAANVIFEALDSKLPKQSLKAAILAKSSFSGAQHRINFDANGDTEGQTFMVTIRNGSFTPIPAPAP
jgi:branched-chain amino acid transport system substrate-binding protein